MDHMAARKRKEEPDSIKRMRVVKHRGLLVRGLKGVNSQLAEMFAKDSSGLMDEQFLLHFLALCWIIGENALPKQWRCPWKDFTLCPAAQMDTEVESILEIAVQTAKYGIS